jgi:hypothetical protein
MKALDQAYFADVDNIDKNKWHSNMLMYNDATFHQTWSYGALSWGEEHLSHLVLMNEGKEVGQVQVRIARFPLIRAGIAYVVSGPMWRRKGEGMNFRHLQNMIRALINEYVDRRGLVLQILPRTANDHDAEIRGIFHEEGFLWRADVLQTIFVDLSPSLEELKKNTRRKWRQTLNRAQKQDIEVDEGLGDEASEAAAKIIEEMKARKKYVEYGDMKNMIDVHKDLPDALKLRMFMCKQKGTAVAVLGWFSAGTVGLPLVAATGNRGLELDASYPLWWKMIEYYTQNGFARCDLGGINQERNPGGFTFKAGLAGDACEVRRYIGQFEAYKSRVSYLGFKVGLLLRATYRNLRVRINKRLVRIPRKSSLGRRMTS